MLSLKPEQTAVTDPNALSDDELLSQYDGIVNRIVFKILKKLGTDVPVEDLKGYAYQGLLDARQKFDATGRVSFGTYAYYRIYGSVLDGIREQGWLTRNHVRRLQRLNAANERLREQAEIDAHSPRATTSEEAYDRVGEMVSEIGMIVYLTDQDTDELSTDPKQEDRLLKEQSTHVLKEAMGTLTDLEREIVRRHYYENTPMKEIADDYDRSKSWVSRIHTRALKKLAQFFEEHR